MKMRYRQILILSGLLLITAFAAVLAIKGGPALAKIVPLAKGCVARPGGNRAAASGDELRSMVKCLPEGSTVALKTGNYGKLVLDNVKGLTLVSQNPAEPASFEMIDIYQSSRIKLMGLKFGGAANGDQYRLQIIESNDVEATDLVITGVAGNMDEVRSGVFARFSRAIAIKRSNVSGTENGIQFLNSSAVTIAGNRIHDYRSDGIQASATSQLLISGNYMSDGHALPGYHPDGIQIFTLHQKASVSDIEITNNLIEKGSGGLMQGIFASDEEGDCPFINIRISNNIVIGSMYHGVTVGHATSGAVTNNLVVPLDGQDNWVMLLNASGVAMDNNTAQYLIRDKLILKDPNLGSNRSYIMPAQEARAAASAWKAKHFPEEARNGT